MSKIETAQTHIYEVEELACKVTGLDYDEIDADTQTIEDKLMDELGVDLQQFQEIVERLLPLVMVAHSGMTEKSYKGFADIKNSMWYVKTEIK